MEDDILTCLVTGQILNTKKSLWLSLKSLHLGWASLLRGEKNEKKAIDRWFSPPKKGLKHSLHMESKQGKKTLQG